MENSSEKNLTIRNEVLDWAQNIAVILTVFVLLFTFVFKIIGVEGQSMVPTLHNNDWLIISNLKKDYKAGDIVVVRKKKFMEVPIVKRIIATGGQEVNINFEKGEVYVDGVKLDEPFINEPTNRKLDMDFPIVVPENEFFVMGDNRNHSSDSRNSALGTVNKQYILGKVLFRFFPIKGFGVVK